MKFSTCYALAMLLLVGGFVAHGIVWNRPDSFAGAVAAFFLGVVFYPGDDQ